ncbi:MAG: nucleotidyltransferase family protein [Thermomicrobiales bacterium]
MVATRYFPLTEIGEICRRYRVRELALFGSSLRDDVRPESDIDLLVEFLPDAHVGFMALGKMERELAALLHSDVDLGPKRGLKPVIRDDVVASSRILFAE